ncbi:MAG TPA: hypothetical protein VHB79_06610 [Polyangiaceae bacterium]|nr:hypothetical protein [Polyangiaceae bacterium]
MKSVWLCWVPISMLGLGAFGGCGGTADSGNAAGAGMSSGGSASGGEGGSSAGGTNHGGSTTNGGTLNAGGATLEECNAVECGPRLGIPNWTCADGSVGGPTGRCLLRPGGTCGWEINNCPMPGEGGAPPQGGQGNTAGEPSVGGAAAEDCGGCAADKVCVFQMGGPGPSHFVCATQNPCGSAAACACIVGQGTCQPNLMGDPPRYCSCDNGLE